MHGDRTDTGRRQSRRTVLRRGSAAVGTGLALSTAGCMATLPPLGQRVRYGRVDAPERADPVYRRWVPDPGAVQHEYDREDDEFSLMYSTPGQLGKETLGADFTIGVDILISRIDYYGVPIRNFDWTMTTRAGAVLRGDVPQATVERVLTDTIYARSGEYQGFSLFQRATGDTWVAVAPSTIVHSEGTHARGNLEAIVDAGQGRIDRYHQVEDTVGRFTERVGAHPFTWYGPDFGNENVGDGGDGSDIKDASLGATTFSFDGQAAYFSYDLFYPEGLPARRVLRGALERDMRPLASAAVDLEYDDPYVRVEMRVPAGRMRAMAKEQSARGPYVTWRVELDGSAAVVRFHHLGGEPVDPSNLKVWGVRDTEPTFHTEDGTLGPGDHVSVSIASDTGDSVRLIWESPDDQASMTIESVEVPARFQQDSTAGTDGS